jgi:hypothetical protein
MRFLVYQMALYPFSLSVFGFSLPKLFRLLYTLSAITNLQVPNITNNQTLLSQP